MKKQRDALQNERKYVHVCYSQDDPLTVVLLLESAGFVTMIESKEMSSFFFSPFTSVLWRQETLLQQELQSTREELSKKEQGLRSMIGKVSCYSISIIIAYMRLLGIKNMSET